MILNREQGFRGSSDLAARKLSGRDEAGLVRGYRREAVELRLTTRVFDGGSFVQFEMEGCFIVDGNLLAWVDCLRYEVAAMMR